MIHYISNNIITLVILTTAVMTGNLLSVSLVNAQSIAIGEVYPPEDGVYYYEGGVDDRFEAFINDDTIPHGDVKFAVIPDNQIHDDVVYDGVSRRGSGTDTSYTSNATVSDIVSDTGMSLGDTFSLTVSVPSSADIGEKTVENITLDEFQFELARPTDGDTVTGSPNLAQVNISEGTGINTNDVQFTIVPDNSSGTQSVTYQASGSATNNDGTRRYVANEDIEDVVTDTNMYPGDTFKLEVAVLDKGVWGTLEAEDIVLGDLSEPLIASLIPANDEELSFDSDDTVTFTAEIIGFDETEHDVRFFIDEDGGNGASYTLNGGSIEQDGTVFSYDQSKSWFESVITDDFAGTFSFRVNVFASDMLAEAETNPFTIASIEAANPEEEEEEEEEEVVSSVSTTNSGIVATRQSGNDQRRSMIAEGGTTTEVESEEAQPAGEVLGAEADAHLQGNDEFIALLAQLVTLVEAIQEAHADEVLATAEAMDLMQQLVQVMTALQTA